MSSMAKLKDSRSCFITRWRVFYKCVQLVQSEIMLISITIILLFNFEKKKTSPTSFCFFETLKLVSPQFLLFTLFCFREKTEKKPYNIYPPWLRAGRKKGWAVKRALRSSFNVWCGVGLARALFLASGAPEGRRNFPFCKPEILFSFCNFRLQY